MPAAQTEFHHQTPKCVADILEAARRDGSYRLRLYYGDPSTGVLWGDVDEGYIGRSTGRSKVPIVLRTRTQAGGHPILDRNIIKIEHANQHNGGVLFDITRKQSVLKTRPRGEKTKMQHGTVPAAELDPATGLRAEDYLINPQRIAADVVERWIDDYALRGLINVRGPIVVALKTRIEGALRTAHERGQQQS